MYNRCTLSEFNAWHASACTAENIPSVGYVMGVAAPENQQTVAYSKAIQNPDSSDDYIFLYGKYPMDNKTILTPGDIKDLNWFASDI